MEIVLLLFAKNVTAAKRKLDEVTRKTFDLYDKAAKNEPIEDELRELV